VYCGNNPLTRVDSNGLSWRDKLREELIHFIEYSVPLRGGRSADYAITGTKEEAERAARALDPNGKASPWEAHRGGPLHIHPEARADASDVHITYEEFAQEAIDRAESGANNGWAGANLGPIGRKIEELQDKIDPRGALGFVPGIGESMAISDALTEFAEGLKGRLQPALRQRYENALCTESTTGF
jgi:hypothetical protein